MGTFLRLTTMVGRGMLSVASLVVVGLAAVQAEKGVRKWECNREPIKPYDIRMGEPQCWFTDKFDTKEEVTEWARSLQSLNEIEGNGTSIDDKNMAYIVANSGARCIGTCEYQKWFEHAMCFVASDDVGGFSHTPWGKPLPATKWDYCRPLFDGKLLGRIELYYSALGLWQAHVDADPRLRAADRAAKGLRPDPVAKEDAAKARFKSQEIAARERAALLKYQEDIELQQKRDQRQRDKANKFADNDEVMEEFFDDFRRVKKLQCQRIRRREQRRKDRKMKRMQMRAEEDAKLTAEQKEQMQEGGMDNSSPCITTNDADYIESAISGIDTKLKSAGANGLSFDKVDPDQAAEDAANMVKEHRGMTADGEKAEADTQN